MTGSAVPYSQSTNLTVLPVPYSIGTGGNTALYESTRAYQIHGGRRRRTNRKRDLVKRRQRTFRQFRIKSKTRSRPKSWFSFLGV